MIFQLFDLFDFLLFLLLLLSRIYAKNETVHLEPFIAKFAKRKNGTAGSDRMAVPILVS